MGTAMAELAEVFEALRSIMLPYASKLDCTSDTKDHLYVNTRHILKNKKPLFFGAVQIRKNCVSCHLMPFWVNPKLLISISPGLKKRMQGTSCFHFTNVDSSLLKEFAALTDAGFKDFESAGCL